MLFLFLGKLYKSVCSTPCLSCQRILNRFCVGQNAKTPLNSEKTISGHGRLFVPPRTDDVIGQPDDRDVTAHRLAFRCACCPSSSIKETERVFEETNKTLLEAENQLIGPNEQLAVKTRGMVISSSPSTKPTDDLQNSMRALEFSVSMSNVSLWLAGIAVGHL